MRRIFKNVIFDQKKKNAKPATLQTRLHKIKYDCQFRNQRPKIREVRYSLGFDIIWLTSVIYQSILHMDALRPGFITMAMSTFQVVVSQRDCNGSTKIT